MDDQRKARIEDLVIDLAEANDKLSIAESRNCVLMGALTSACKDLAAAQDERDMLKEQVHALRLELHRYQNT